MRRTGVKKDFGQINKGGGNFKVWTAVLLAASILTGIAGIGHSATGVQGNVQNMQLAQATLLQKAEHNKKRALTFLRCLREPAFTL
jgi:hypothetical protein